MNQTTADKLKSCPFCGTEPKVRHIGNEHTKKRSVKIKCPKCRIERTDASLKHGFDWLDRVAIEQWNKRSLVSEPVPVCHDCSADELGCWKEEALHSRVSEPIEDGWISVEDRLPREDEYSQLAYVIDRTHRRIPITGRFAGDKWQVTTWVGKDVILLPLEMVTHWRDTKWNEPLPEPQEYDPHEVAQMKKEMDLTNNGEGQ